MSLSILPTFQTIMPRIQFPFSGVGGTEPYLYEVLAGGAGGTINASTGVYTGPATTNDDPYNHPEKNRDTVRVTDYDGNHVDAVVRVTNPLGILGDIIQSELDLDDNQVYLWDQKIQTPTDSKLYIAIAAFQPKPLASNNRLDSNGFQVQTLNMVQNCSIDILSRGVSARDRKEEVLMALQSVYAQQMMALNSLGIGRLSNNFVNLSQVDGAAIPYRFNISVNVTYAVVKKATAPYYDQFEDVSVTTEP